MLGGILVFLIIRLKAASILFLTTRKHFLNFQILRFSKCCVSVGTEIRKLCRQLTKQYTSFGIRNTKIRLVADCTNILRIYSTSAKSPLLAYAIVRIYEKRFLINAIDFVIPSNTLHHEVRLYNCHCAMHTHIHIVVVVSEDNANF